MVIFTLFSLCLWIIQLNSVVCENEHRKCYKRFGNCDILCPDPYSRIWRVPNERTCLDFCAADKTTCLGLVFENSYNVCNLYNISLSSPNVVLAPAFKKTFYSLNNTNCIAGYTGTAPILTTTVYTPKWTSVVTQTTIAVIPVTDQSPFTDQSTITTVTPSSLSSLDTTVSFGTTPGGGGGGQKSSCPSGTQSAFVGFGGQGLQGVPPVSTANGVSDPSPCIAACSSNKDITGKDIQCQAVTFDAAASQCVFYNEKPKPDGKATFVSAATQNVLLKTCLPASPATANCKDVLMPANMENILNGHVKKDIASGIDSLSACIARCVSETSFQCQSANYVSSKGQCQLNDANSLTASADFGKAPSGGATYVENTCIGRRVLKKELLAVIKESSEDYSESETLPFDNSAEDSGFETWTEWTSCIKEADDTPVRLRIRLCTGNSLNCKGKKVDHQFCL